MTFPEPIREESTPAEATPAPAEWRLWLPLGTVTLALLALVVIPILRTRLVAPLDSELHTVVEPGRSLVTRIHVAIAMEGALLHGIIENRDTLLIDRYRGSVADEAAAYVELKPLVQQLGPGARREFRELTAQQGEWHSAIDRYLMASATARDAGDPLHSAKYEELLLAASRLDEALSTEADLRWAEISATNRAQSWISVVVGILALGAALIVGWLGRRLRVFAAAAERRRAELQKAIEARARMVRGISHDLKNPLNVILGYTELLQQGVKGLLTEGQHESLSRIRASVESLLSLINDMLDLSRAESGALRITPRKTLIPHLVRETIVQHRASAAIAGQRLEAQLPTDFPEVTTDPPRVQQILGNLLSNAIKYTPIGGEITVRASLKTRDGHTDGMPWAAIEVVDTGPGIPGDQLETIFDEFSRLQVHEDKPGAGLGLAIARRISRLLGGDITAANGDEHGSVFTLWLPLR
ncbi:MAG TPA: HAMP domain-containing sensor histidine kinase [Gemmatimonadaceae bacterium]